MHNNIYRSIWEYSPNLLAVVQINGFAISDVFASQSDNSGAWQLEPQRALFSVNTFEVPLLMSLVAADAEALNLKDPLVRWCDCTHHELSRKIGLPTVEDLLGYSQDLDAVRLHHIDVWNMNGPLHPANLPSRVGFAARASKESERVSMDRHFFRVRRKNWLLRQIVMKLFRCQTFETAAFLLQERLALNGGLYLPKFVEPGNMRDLHYADDLPKTQSGWVIKVSLEEKGAGLFLTPIDLANCLLARARDIKARNNIHALGHAVSALYMNVFWDSGWGRVRNGTFDRLFFVDAYDETIHYAGVDLTTGNGLIVCARSKKRMGRAIVQKYMEELNWKLDESMAWLMWPEKCLHPQQAPSKSCIKLRTIEEQLDSRFLGQYHLAEEYTDYAWLPKQLCAKQIDGQVVLQYPRGNKERSCELALIGDGVFTSRDGRFGLPGVWKFYADITPACLLRYGLCGMYVKGEDSADAFVSYICSGVNDEPSQYECADVRLIDKWIEPSRAGKY